jgi:hypothetical protein
MTAFFSVGFEFSERHKKELTKLGFAESVVAEIQSALDVLKSYATTAPSSRRELIDQIDAILISFPAAEQAIEAANHQTITELGSRAYGVLQYSGGHPKTNVVLRDLKHAISAYVDAAHAAKRSLEASGPKRGPEPEYELEIASAIHTVLERGGITISDDEKGPLVSTIAIAYEALGIARASGVLKKRASKVIERAKIVLRQIEKN